MPWVDWRWCAEIDPFASAVLKHHYPHTPNLGDVNEIDADAVDPVDIVVFGSPCQSWSVAGKRLGLDDPRGNLALVALRLISRIRPKWVVFENVPGLLSSDGGRDFGAFLGLLGECGYGFGYRVLDAQHAGVPQRRRRVFVVGHIGDWRPPAAVLFEQESLRGDTPPRREAGQNPPTHPSRGTAAGGLGTDFDRDGGLIATAPRARDGARGVDSNATDTLIAGCPQERDHKDSDGDTKPGHLVVTHTLRADGFDASEDGTGRGTPLVAVDWQNSAGGPNSEDVFMTLGAERTPALMTLAFDPRQIHHPANHSNPKPGDPCYPLRGVANAEPAIVLPQMSVRRLTPVECEKLQGFSPGWTAIQYRGKPAADGPRYRALGNSMAVPVVRWIGERIRLFEDVTRRLAEEDAA